MWEIISGIAAVCAVILYFVYRFFEARAIKKAQKLPPKTGVESFAGKTANVVELVSERENETLLHVLMEGTHWKAIAKEEKRGSIKVGDKVLVGGIENLRLIVKSEER
jgi:membrane-bound ClpP family serine protease